MDHPIRTVLWQRLDAPGLEYCMLQPVDKGWLLQGDAITLLDGHPARVVYQVRVDDAWKTRRLAVDLLVGSNRQRLHVIQGGRRGWRLRPSNTPLPHLDGCTDVDLGLSPVTNTIAIRRLNLDVDASADLRTAWVRFPETGEGEMTIAPRAQRYTRIDGRRYHYQSGEIGEPFNYSAVLEIDDLGLVTHYERGWERTGMADTA